MKHRRLVAVKCLCIFTCLSVSIAFQLGTLHRPSIERTRQGSERVTTQTGGPTKPYSSFRGDPCSIAADQRSSSTRDPCFRCASFSMMARTHRARAIKAEQIRRQKAAVPVVLSAKDKRAANRARRALYREKFASSGSRLVKLRQEDEASFYIGFVGKNGAGRAAALKAVEAFLRRATELKVAKYYAGDASIKLVDAGNLRFSEMPGKNDRKLSLLRRCDLLVHVVRCFDLYEPKSTERVDDAGGDELAVRRNVWDMTGTGVENEGDIEWPLAPTPVEDVLATKAEMALADLHFIEERQRSNHTRWFWRDKRRAYNERDALELVAPALEDIYAAGGELKPAGIDFRDSCLKDGATEAGTGIKRRHMRDAIKEIGFLTPKPVVYVANIPPEAAGSSHEAGVNDRGNEALESGAVTAKDRMVQANKITRLQSEFGVPAVAACLTARDSQQSLGATIFNSIPRHVLSRDPKLKKAERSAANKARERHATRRIPGGERGPISGRKPEAGRARVPSG